MQNRSRKAPHVRYRNRRFQRDEKESPLAFVFYPYRLEKTRSIVPKTRDLSTKSPRVFLYIPRVLRESGGLFAHDGRAKYPTCVSGLKISRKAACSPRWRIFV